MKLARRAVFAIAALALALPAHRAAAQAWRDASAHLGTTARVLIVGTRPEDEDNALIAWLSLGRHIETAYLSLTRGESGVNLTGAEHQAPLAVVRTAELLAERERDGAHQYFTRAYDFGPTRVDSIVDASWPHDSLLKDVVSVIRAFRPQIVISLVSSSGERDATRRLTARMVTEAFAAAADTVRLPTSSTSNLPAWTISRLFTRVDSATLGASHVVGVDVGEFDRGRGLSYAEIGADIRELQRSQPAPASPELGRLRRFLRLDSTRVGDDPSLFGAVDTTISRFRGQLSAVAQQQLDTLESELGDVYAEAPSGEADSLAVRLARVAKRTSGVRLALPCSDVSGVPACAGAIGDLAVALNTIRERATRAMLGASGLVIDGVAARELVAAGDSVPVAVTVYNGGSAPVAIHRLAVSAGKVLSTLMRDTSVIIAPDSAARWSATPYVLSPTYHWWQINGLVDGTMIHDFHTTRRNPVMPQLIGGEDRIVTSRVEATIAIGGVEVPVIARPLVYRSITAVRGDARHPIAGVPATSVLLERSAEYERANLSTDRIFRVYLWSARSTADTLTVELRLPTGLKADSLRRTVALPPFGTRNVFFRLYGMLRPASDTISVTAVRVASPASGHLQPMTRSGAPEQFGLGVITHEYAHIPSQQFVLFANDRLEVVDVHIPQKLRVAYVKGTDDVHAALTQLRVNVQTIDPSLLSVMNLSTFTTVLIGADAFAGDALAGAVPSLHDFVRGGGTVVVLPGRGELAASGLGPYPLTFDSVPGRVSDPAAAVHATDARSQLLNWPNVITAKDFEDWTGERARNLPSAFDPRYHTVLTMADSGQAPTAATILTARMGKGTIVYTSLLIDEQLAATSRGAARLMINLLSAGLSSEKEK